MKVKRWVKFRETILNDEVYYKGQLAYLEMEEIETFRLSWFEFVGEPEFEELEALNARAKRLFFSRRL